MGRERFGENGLETGGRDLVAGGSAERTGRFLVLAAYEPQLSKELLVPVDTLGDPRDNGSADKNDL